MATITSNLTNLKNSRLSIINKANTVLGTTMKETTTLSEIPSFLEATGGSGAMINFDTWNAKSITITESDFSSNSNCYYKLITAERDGYLSLAFAIRGRIGIWCTIKIKSKGSGDDPYTWPTASCAEGTDWYDKTGGSSTASLNTYISKGNTVAIVVHWRGPAGFEIRYYGCTFYYK